MDGLIEVAAINWVENEEICEEFSIIENKYAFKIYSSDYKDTGERYFGEVEWRTLSNAASDKMQHFITDVNSNNYNTFIEDNKDSLKVLMFYNRHNIPPVYKVLSKLSKSTSFGFVSSFDELSKRFSIRSIPSIWVVTNSFDYSTDWFQGDLKLEPLKLFLNDYLTGKKKANNNNQRSVIELNKEKMKQGLWDQNDQNLCLIYFSSGTAQDKKVIETIENVIGKFKNDPIVFTFINSQKSIDFYKNFRNLI